MMYGHAVLNVMHHVFGHKHLWSLDHSSLVSQRISILIDLLGTYKYWAQHLSLVYQTFVL